MLVILGLAQRVLGQQFAVPTITGRNMLWTDRLSMKGTVQLTHTLRPMDNSMASINLEHLEKNLCGTYMIVVGFMHLCI